jgi:hypothetical protein
MGADELPEPPESVRRKAKEAFEERYAGQKFDDLTDVMKAIWYLHVMDRLPPR